jgi:hypothetical protein
MQAPTQLQLWEYTGLITLSTASARSNPFAYVNPVAYGHSSPIFCRSTPWPPVKEDCHEKEQVLDKTTEMGPWDGIITVEAMSQPISAVFTGQRSDHDVTSQSPAKRKRGDSVSSPSMPSHVIADGFGIALPGPKGNRKAPSQDHKVSSFQIL